MNRVLVFFLGFMAGVVTTAITIFIVVFGLNLFSGRCAPADSYIADEYWEVDSVVVEIPEVEECYVIETDSAVVEWVEY